MIRSDELVEWDYVLDHYYGTQIHLRQLVESGEDVVLQVLGRMAIRLKRRLKNVVTIMLTTSDHEMLQQRLVGRGYTGSDLLARLKHGEEEIVHASLFDHVIPDADILSPSDVKRILIDIAANRGQ